MSYTFNEHKHRFAIWTAARAVQRSFTTTQAIAGAINTTSLREFAESERLVSQKEFDDLHKEWSKSLMVHFDACGPDCSYGRAAKVIAIYLKTSCVLPEHGISSRCSVIHPPIDSILLKALAKESGEKKLAKMTWTNFNEGDYWTLVEVLRKKFKSFDWKLEEHWNSQ